MPSNPIVYNSPVLTTMSSAVADLETSLQAMLALKPPGVSGSRISTVTSLCMANVQVRPDKNVLYFHQSGPNLCITSTTTDAKMSPGRALILSMLPY